MVSGKSLLKKYILQFHKDEIKQMESLKKQCKISIDYESLNEFLIKESGKDFWELQIHEFIDQIDSSFNTEYTTLKITNVPERDNLHDLDAKSNNKWISTRAMIKNITDVRVDLEKASYICNECGQNNIVSIEDPTQHEVIPPFCKNPKCAGTSKSMRFDKDTSIYRNYKLLKLEEPLELRSGGNTREFKAIVLDYLASP